LHDALPIYSLCFRDDFGEIEDSWFEHLLSTEREELAREERCARCRVRDLFEIIPQWRCRRQLVERELHVALDDREQVVEVVCDSARELAHCLDLLRLAELILQPALLRDVDGEHETRVTPG